jgi:hypothetical protein
MNNMQLQDLARLGAQTRLAALDKEREALLEMFPRPAGRAATNHREERLRITRGSKARRDAHRRPQGTRRTDARLPGDRRAKNGVTAASQLETAADVSPTAANEARRRKGISHAARKAQGERMRAYWAAKRAGDNSDDGADAPAMGTLQSRKGPNAAGKKWDGSQRHGTTEET